MSKTSKKEPLDSGTKAPDFNLKDTPDQRVTLSDFAGQHLVLVFYPADFSPICSSELAVFNELVPELQDLDAQVVGISVDNVWTHIAFGEERHFQFPLLSDFHPKGEIAKQYNAYRDEDGEAERALYVIDEDGTVSWGYISPVGINPGANGVLKVLERNQHKSLV